MQQKVHTSHRASICGICMAIEQHIFSRGAVPVPNCSAVKVAVKVESGHAYAPDDVVHIHLINISILDISIHSIYASIKVHA